MDYKYRHHGVFVAFAPFDNPKIAVAALVEHGCGGSSAAAPVVEKVVNTYMKKYLPEKHEKLVRKDKESLARFYRKRRQEQEEKLRQQEAEEEDGSEG